MLPLGLGPGMVDDDLVVQFPLSNRRAIQLPPPLAGVIEGPFERIQGVFGPVRMKPGRGAKKVLDPGQQRLGFG